MDEEVESPLPDYQNIRPPEDRSLVLGAMTLMSWPSKIFGFLLRYWKQTIIIGLIVTVLYQNFSPTRYLLWVDTIPYLRNQVTELEAENAEMVAANELLVTRINKTNQTIINWKNKTDVLQQRLDVLGASIIEHQDEVAIDVAEILADPTPPTCEASINYLIDATEDLTWDIK